MNVTGLFLGCAAALAVCSHADAEDAVVATEAEQAARVNVCDVYGSGYTQLAGTGTCVKLSGQLRYEKHFSQGGDTSHRRNSQFSLDFETRSD